MPFIQYLINLVWLFICKLCFFFFLLPIDNEEKIRMKISYVRVSYGHNNPLLKATLTRHVALLLYPQSKNVMHLCI